MKEFLINDQVFDAKQIIKEFLVNANEQVPVIFEEVSPELFILRYQNKVERIGLHRQANELLTLSWQGNYYQGKKLSLRDKLKTAFNQSQKSSDKERKISSPMPGTVLKILKENGAVVENGDTILIVEAMKMENEIKSPIAGRIIGLNVKVGQVVANRQFLCSIVVDEL